MTRFWVPMTRFWVPRTPFHLPMTPLWVPKTAFCLPKTPVCVPKTRFWVPKTAFYLPKTPFWGPKMRFLPAILGPSTPLALSGGPISRMEPDQHDAGGVRARAVVVWVRSSSGKTLCPIGSWRLKWGPRTLDEVLGPGNVVRKASLDRGRPFMDVCGARPPPGVLLVKSCTAQPSAARFVQVATTHPMPATCDAHAAQGPAGEATGVNP